MNKSCEYCQYNGAYASIINPCEDCPNNYFMWKHDPHNYCPNCGSKMDLEALQ